MKRNKFYLYIQSARHESPVVAININPSCHRGADEKYPSREEGHGMERNGISLHRYSRDRSTTSIHGVYKRRRLRDKFRLKKKKERKKEKGWPNRGVAYWNGTVIEKRGVGIVENLGIHVRPIWHRNDASGGRWGNVGGGGKRRESNFEFTFSTNHPSSIHDAWHCALHCATRIALFSLLTRSFNSTSGPFVLFEWLRVKTTRQILRRGLEVSRSLCTPRFVTKFFSRDHNFLLFDVESCYFNKNRVDSANKFFWWLFIINVVQYCNKFFINCFII